MAYIVAWELSANVKAINRLWEAGLSLNLSSNLLPCPLQFQQENLCPSALSMGSGLERANDLLKCVDKNKSELCVCLGSISSCWWFLFYFIFIYKIRILSCFHTSFKKKKARKQESGFNLISTPKGAISPSILTWSPPNLKPPLTLTYLSLFLWLSFQIM